MKPFPRARGFTLIELVTVIAIISLLTILAVPEFGRVMEKARSASCMGNLRQIGTAVGLYANDNDGKMPFINNPSRPVYGPDEELPNDAEPMTMDQAFGPYGVNGRVLRCPADVAQVNYYGKEGTSYEWRPMADGETKIAPMMFTRRGGMVAQKPARVRIVTDVTGVHGGRLNRLYLDGHVTWVQDFWTQN